VGDHSRDGVSAHRLLSEAAGITFYTILAIFPALATLVSLYGLIADPATVSDHLGTLSGVMPSGGMEVVGDQVKRIASTATACSASARSQDC
jgi:membrane protein